MAMGLKSNYQCLTQSRSLKLFSLKLCGFHSKKILPLTHYKIKFSAEITHPQLSNKLIWARVKELYRLFLHEAGS